MKIGTKVIMYGCGDGCSTFWDGEIGKISCQGFDKNTVIVIPKDFPLETHPMHVKQLRVIKVKRKKK